MENEPCVHEFVGERTGTGDDDGARQVRRLRSILLVATLAIYTLTSYGGTRSPDSEIVYRTAESLAERGSFSVDRDLESWPGFGLADGAADGRYSVFGPLQSILLAPWVKAANLVNRTGWYEGIDLPNSHYYDYGVNHEQSGTEPSDRAPHAARFIASFFNVVVGALCVLAFFGLVLAITGHPAASFLLSLLFGFGTPMWAYSGTMFSEPLAILFVLLSLRALVVLCATDRPRMSWRWLWAGAALGLAVAAHISAALFAPFFLLFALLELGGRGVAAPVQARALGRFVVGLGFLLALLGLYNLLRFGNPLETGRGVDVAVDVITLYGAWVLPWDGLSGFLLGPAKSLLFYAPVVAAALVVWPRFHRRYRSLSIALGSAAIVRMFFIASRSDWHGGWCLGPRLLLVLVPLLILPLGTWLAEVLEKRRVGKLRIFMALGAVALAEQYYFALGELFSFLHASSRAARTHGLVADFVNDWSYSPLVHGLNWRCGPFLLERLQIGVGMLWLCGTLVVALAVVAWTWRTERHWVGEEPVRQGPVHPVVP